MTKILVTGASGFIGRALVMRLLTNGHQVIRLGSADGDIADATAMNGIDGHLVRHVIHLAARTFVPSSWSDPQAFFRTNVMGTINVLEFCKRNRVPLTNVSAYVYGHPDRLPIVEDAPVRPSNPYALSKRMAEEACEFYSAMHGLSVTTVRPFNVYGPGQHGSFLVPAIVEQVVGDSPRVKVMDLLPRRDYIYIDDLTEALVATMSESSGYRVFNVGSGCSYSVRDVIDVAQDAAGTNKPVECESTSRPNELMDVVADIGLAARTLHWTPRIPFRKGIERIVQHERNRIENDAA